MTVFFSQLINGLSLGSIYALIALGYSMVYGIILLLNFAHGDVIMVGAYMSWFVMNQLGLGPVTAVCATIITCTLLGVVIEKVAYTPLRNAPRISLLITAIGVSFFLAGMGTTAVCALVRGGEATLCHAGDSRAYLCRGGKLTQLTHDHSYVQELVDCGTITEEEAEHHPQKNIITRALGVDYRLEPEVTSVQLQAKDLLLLCSDGLTNMVPVEQMEQLLAQGPFYDLPDRLVDAANENGGSDNITALLLAVEPTEVHHG